MKKIITIVLLGALVLGMAITGTAFAREGQRNSANGQTPANGTLAEKVREIPQMGTVVSKNANQIVISGPGMDFVQITITLNDETKFYDGTVEHEQGEEPTEISISDIKKGDKIVAHGKIVRDDEESPTSYIAARVVKVNQFPRLDAPGDSGREQPPTMNVLFKSASGNTITVTDPAGENELTVTLAENAKIFKLVKGEDDEKATREEVEVSGLSEGDKLVITGKRVKDDEGNVTVTAMIILVVDEFPAQRPGKDRGDDKMHQVLGTFNSFDGDYMILDPIAEDAEQIKIKLSEKTAFVKFEKSETEGEKPEKIEMSKDDLKAGQKVSVQVIPTRDGDSETREATAVVVVFLDEFPPARAGGEITAINAKSITIKMKNEDEVTFEITDETVFQIHSKDADPVEATKSDFKKGDMVGIVHRDGAAILITKRAE